MSMNDIMQMVANSILNHFDSVNQDEANSIVIQQDGKLYIMTLVELPSEEE